LRAAGKGRLIGYLFDAGLPVSATLVGMLMAIGLSLLSPGSRGLRLLGGMGGLLGALLFIAAGGTSALPTFAVWVPLIGTASGVVVAGSFSSDAEARGGAPARASDPSDRPPTDGRAP